MLHRTGRSIRLSLVVLCCACMHAGAEKAKPVPPAMYGPTGIYGHGKGKAIRVADVEFGSPAFGRIKTGMVIVGVNGSTFKSHVCRELADAIDAAETEEGKGILTLTLAKPIDPHPLPEEMPTERSTPSTSMARLSFQGPTPT